MKTEVEISKKVETEYPKLCIHKTTKEIILATSITMLEAKNFYNGTVLSGERIGTRTAKWYLFSVDDYEDLPIGSKVVLTQE